METGLRRLVCSFNSFYGSLQSIQDLKRYNSYSSYRRNWHRAAQVQEPERSEEHILSTRQTHQEDIDMCKQKRL